MHEDALAAKRAGLRVTMTTPGGSPMDETHDTEVCGNCGGLGKLYLQTFVAGPFHDPPSGDHIGFHNGKWWRMTLHGYTCPVCGKDILL